MMAAYEECRGLVAQLESEHRKFRELAARLAGPGGLRKPLFDFGDLLEQHIQSEERRLFAAFELLVPASDAERAGGEIKRLLEQGRTAKSGDGTVTP